MGQLLKFNTENEDLGVLFWPRKTIVHNMSLLTWLNISQAKLLYEILQIRFNGRRFAPLYYTTTAATII
jgi:hypothetical protein